MIYNPRIARERRTLQAMIELYCRKVHASGGGLCKECSALSAYAQGRLDGCRFADAKPVCNKCTVHCYRPQMREAIQAVMRSAGLRMLLRHPLLALSHVVDGLRAERVRRPRRARTRARPHGLRPKR